MATLNEVSAKLLEVDAKQDQEIALLKHRVEQLENEDDNEMIKEIITLQTGSFTFSSGLNIKFIPNPLHCTQ